MRAPLLVALSIGLLAACSSHDPSRAVSGPAVIEAGSEAEEQAAVAPTPDAAGHASHASSAAPAAAPVDTRPRIGAIGPHTWIWKKPERTGLALGKMRIGTTVVLKSPEPIDGPGCKGKWYAIEPRGHVCDDETATLDLEDPYFKALAFSAPANGTWPYRYAHSNGAPMYSRVPTPAEWEKAEQGFGPTNSWKTLGQWAVGHEENIVDDPIKATDEVPYFLKDGKRTVPAGNFHPATLVLKKIPAGSMLAFSKAFEVHGRVWLLTPDAMVVPADRVSDMKRTSFRAVHFSETDMRLPLAWNRAKKPIAKYERDGAKFRATADTLAPKTPIEITGDPIKKDGWVYYELKKEPGKYVGKSEDPNKQLDIDLVITRPASKVPNGIGADEKWLEARIVSGTLTAYEGLTPVMTTLFSPGKGGPPLPDYKFPEDHSKYATTALGTFPLEWKEKVATMSNEKGEPKVLWFTDVPHQQYLKAPLAMHVTYWHEDFGKRKSAECLNVSPTDGEWLFGWTLPQLPEGWNAVGAGNGNGKSTPVVVSAN